MPLQGVSVQGTLFYFMWRRQFMVGDMLGNVRRVKPLVHCISNYVTARDCANMLLAASASPIMADDPHEAADITSRCDALVINLGTLSDARIQAMLLAGQRANEINIPVTLDPVGVGGSPFRMEAARAILSAVRLTVIRGNAGEIASLAGLGRANRGLDDDGSPADGLSTAKALAASHQCVVAMTGKIDVVTDGVHAFAVNNGCAMMRQVTGAGCQLSALCGAFLGANANAPLNAVLAAVTAMGVAGEVAFSRLPEGGGNASLSAGIIDAVCNLTPHQLEDMANYDVL